MRHAYPRSLGKKRSVTSRICGKTPLSQCPFRETCLKDMLSTGDLLQNSLDEKSYMHHLTFMMSYLSQVRSAISRTLTSVQSLETSIRFKVSNKSSLKQMNSVNTLSVRHSGRGANQSKSLKGKKHIRSGRIK